MQTSYRTLIRNFILVSYNDKFTELETLESWRSCVSIDINGKWSRIDVLGAQMQTSYPTFVRNFFKIPFDDT